MYMYSTVGLVWPYMYMYSNCRVSVVLHVHVQYLCV